MQEILELRCPRGASSLADIMAALEQAAVAHSVVLHIDHDRMLSEFGVLWMLARCRVTLERMPSEGFTVQTFLRKPTAAVSHRDFTVLDDRGVCGTAVQTWVLADAEERKLRNLKTVPPLWALPTPVPERTDFLRHLSMPEHLPEHISWTVATEEIDSNGHLNNVKYILHAEAMIPRPCTCLEVLFDRECFAGETLTLESNGTYVRGVRADGLDAFRCRFYKENEK